MSEDTILVPLDGSPLSECAVPYGAALAKAIGTSVVLLNVREDNDGRVTHDPGLRPSILAAEESHQHEYLRGVAERMAGQGLAVETESLLGYPGDEILKAIEKLDPRLLVLATHGRSGLSRWRYGSVAGRLIREAPVPTFVIGPEVLQDEDRTPAVKRILVPLDGSAMAEGALRLATELAQMLAAEIVLIRVVPWLIQPYPYGVPGVDVAQLDTEIQKAGEEYLNGIRQGLVSAQQVKIQLLRGAAAEALINYVRDGKVDLVVMSSHTRTGLVRAVLGSVSDRMLQAVAPVLFVRPEGIATVRHAERGRFCHNCGRASPYVQVLEEDHCLRCGQLLHACGNCVYQDGIACMLQRPEAHDVYPGKTCAYFQFRETEPLHVPKPAVTSRGG